MRTTLLIACVALRVLILPGDAQGRPVAVALTPRMHAVGVRSARRVISDASLQLALPRGWHGVVTYGGLGSDPFGVGELIVGNFPVPTTSSGCEGWAPRLSRHAVLLRIYDYGAIALGRTPAVRRLRLPAVRPVRDPAIRALATARERFRGRALIVDAVFGSRRPPTALLRRVGRILGSAGVAG